MQISEDNGSLSDGEVAGVVIGVIILITLLGVTLLVLWLVWGHCKGKVTVNKGKQVRGSVFLPQLLVKIFSSLPHYCQVKSITSQTLMPTYVCPSLELLFSLFSIISFIIHTQISALCLLSFCVANV